MVLIVFILLVVKVQYIIKKVRIVFMIGPPIDH